MLRNFWLTALRNALRHKGYALICLFCLSLGLSAFLMIAVWVRHELSYDRFFTHSDRLFRVISEHRFPDQVQPSILTPGPLAAELERSYAEVRSAVRLAWTGERLIRSGEKAGYENGIVTVDPAFLTLFDFPLERGNAATALQDLFSIVLTRPMAEKYFGAEDPMGRRLTMDGRFDLTVTGVLAPLPANTHFNFDMMVHFEMVERLGWKIDAWDFSMARTYVWLRDSVDPAGFNGRLEGLVRRYDPDSPIELVLQPVPRIHLFTDSGSEGESGRILYVLVFGLTGGLILVMAGINFINLTTARAESRGREIGLRKVVGASRGMLKRQFLAEAVFSAAAGLAASPLLIGLALPLFNQMTGADFSPADFLNGPMLATAAGATLLTGLLAGSYPAFLLSSFQPSRVLGGRTREGGGPLRRVMVVFQVSVSLILIITAGVISSQIDYLRRKDLGFDKEHVLSIPLGISNADNPRIYRNFRDEVSGFRAVEGISAAFTHLSWFGSRADRLRVGGRRLDEETPIYLTSVEFGFVETLGIQLVEGRSFSREFGADRGSLIVNQRFASLLDEGPVLGRVVEIGEDYQGKIVGVMKDFHIEGVTEAVIGPLVLFCNPGVNYIFVRLAPGNLPENLSFLETAWGKVAPHLPFRYSFLDEDFDSSYRSVERLASVIRCFAVLAGLIACLGLLGLASFAAVKRTREIGIRRVLGASTGGLVGLLCRDFLRLVLLANLAAWPVAWGAARSWLAGFPYRWEIGWIPFALAALLVLAATLLTVGGITLRAAAADPVRSLRAE
jgi:putative ABC transport system permease protein